MLYLSTLMREKGLIDLIEAIPLVEQAVGKVLFIFSGEWFREEDRDRALALVRGLRVEEQVKFTGAVESPEKEKLFEDADMFVLPSHGEGQPFAVLEAMRAGLPVVAKDTGCVGETVIDGATGFIVDKQNPRMLAERVMQLVRDPLLRQEMGEASRHRFLDNYTLDRWAERMADVFDEVLAES